MSQLPEPSVSQGRVHEAFWIERTQVPLSCLLVNMNFFWFFMPNKLDDMGKLPERAASQKSV